MTQHAETRPEAPPVARSEGQQSAPASSGIDEAEEVALVRFRVRECCLYSVPPASSIGHRAELWDVDNWLQELSLQVVSVEDSCYVRLFDKETGELFAECPMPDDHTKFHTVVEPVIDSSRYFVLKVVDRESNRHAFIGVGFRERGQASDFNAALDDHRSYLRRKAEAAQLSMEHGNLQDDGPIEKKDMSIQGTIHLKIDKRSLSNKASSSSLFKHGMKALSASPGLSKMSQGVLLPPPPKPPAVGVSITAPVATEHSTPVMSGGWADFSENAADVSDGEDNEWGDFEGTTL